MCGPATLTWSKPNASDGMITLIFGFMNRSSENLTSDAVTGSPFEKRAVRSWNVHVRPSGDVFHEVARPGPTPVAVAFTSVS